MKKITLLIASFTFLCFSLQAQNELVSKKGFKILPEAGDIALGVDFAPFINTLNFMGGTSTGPKMSFGDGLSIFGKYYATDNFAFRVKLAINHVANSERGYVIDQSIIGPGDGDLVMDEATFSYSRFSFGLGFEKRRGHGRLQGYYGADLFFELSDGGSGKANSNFSAEYANPYDAFHIDPSTSDFINGGSTENPKRFTEINQGYAMGFGVRGFIGVEYFIAPKISIGGEVGWGVAYQMGFDGSTTTEEWYNQSVRTTTVENGGLPDQFIVGTTGSTQGFFENNGYNTWLGLNGNINIIFHF